MAKKSWLSISLPQIKSASKVLHLEKKGFKSVKIYPKGSKIFNYQSQKIMRAKYLLVEGG